MWKCKAFQKGGLTPNFTFLQSVLTVKTGFKWVSFPQGCVILDSESSRRIFGIYIDIYIFFLNIGQKVFISRGGGVQRQFGQKFTFCILSPFLDKWIKQASHKFDAGLMLAWSSVHTVLVLGCCWLDVRVMVGSGWRDYGLMLGWCLDSVEQFIGVRPI